MKLTCDHVTKVYSGKEVLKDVSLTLESGKVYGLIGKSGAGKTTLLSILTGQNPATRGEVTLDGEPIWENGRALDQLCFARELPGDTQSAVSNFKVRTYLKVAKERYSLWDIGMEKRLLALFRLDRNKKICKLSDDQRSMMSVLVGMCSKASFTLLDEPTFGLDAAARDQFYRLLVDEHTESGRTFLISTHILEEVSGIMENVILLQDGEVISMCGTEELSGSARFVSGLEDDVNRVAAGMRKQ